MLRLFAIVALLALAACSDGDLGKARDAGLDGEVSEAPDAALSEADAQTDDAAPPSALQRPPGSLERPPQGRLPDELRPPR